MKLGRAYVEFCCRTRVGKFSSKHLELGNQVVRNWNTFGITWINKQFKNQSNVSKSLQKLLRLTKIHLCCCDFNLELATKARIGQSHKIHNLEILELSLGRPKHLDISMLASE
jgi:hypothetical protein